MRARWRRSAPRRVRTPCDCRIQADWTAICVRYREPSQGNVWVSGRSASCLSAGILQSDNGPFTLHAGTRVFARVCACSVKDPYFTVRARSDRRGLEEWILRVFGVYEIHTKQCAS